MAYNGTYEIRVQDPDWGDVIRAKSDHECWGGEVMQPNGRDVLITHSVLCDGKVHGGELYITRRDRRDRTVAWRLSMWCAVEFHSEHLDGDLDKWTYFDPELVEKSKRELLSTLGELEKPIHQNRVLEY